MLEKASAEISPSNSENKTGLSRAKLYLSALWSSDYAETCTVWANFRLFFYTCSMRTESESPQYFLILILLSEICSHLSENCNILLPVFLTHVTADSIDINDVFLDYENRVEFLFSLGHLPSCTNIGTARLAHYGNKNKTETNHCFVIKLLAFCWHFLWLRPDFQYFFVTYLSLNICVGCFTCFCSVVKQMSNIRLNCLAEGKNCPFSWPSKPDVWHEKLLIWMCDVFRYFLSSYYVATLLFLTVEHYAELWCMLQQLWMSAFLLDSCVVLMRMNISNAFTIS